MTEITRDGRKTKETVMSWLRKIRKLLPQEINGPLALVYEKVAVPGLSGFHRQVAGEIASSLRSGRVLDIGTGPAHLLVEIARDNPRLELLGLDLSRRMLRIAGAGIKQARSCIRLVRADVRNLPFADDSFDLVVSTLSLHHWRDPLEGIQECVRVTAPGGECWIYDLRSDARVRKHADLVTGKWFRRLVLGFVFKFHGVHPRAFAVRSVSDRLGGGAMVRLNVKPAYLKLSIIKLHCRSQEGTTRSRQPRVLAIDHSASLASSARHLT